MIEIKHLNNCSFQTAVEIWNRGFEGYAVNLTQTLDSLLARIISHGISVTDSLIAFLDNAPVGFLLNGLRTSGDTRIAWNGGTGVVPELRGTGIGKKLVEAAIDLYEERSVDIAMLEALSDNESAIRLYSSCGYKVSDWLTFLRHDDVLRDWITPSTSERYRAVPVAPAAIGKLAFYYKSAPWQAQWESVALAGGESLVVLDAAGVQTGYALFKKRFAPEGNIESIGLFQCEVAPGRTDADQIALFTLRSVFEPQLGKVRRSGVNLRKSNELVVKLLGEAGFTTFVEQAHMVRKF